MKTWGMIALASVVVGGVFLNVHGVETQKKTPSSPSSSTPAQVSESTAKPTVVELGRMAAAAFSKKDWDTARRHYLEILEQNPDHPSTLVNLGTLEQQAGRSEEATLYLERAVSEAPGMAHAWTMLGLLYYEKDSMYRSISCLSRAAHEDPLDARPHHYLGLVMRGNGWLDAAEAELTRALELNPDYADAHFNLAVLLSGRKPMPYEMAKRHYDRAVKLGAERDRILEKELEDAKRQNASEPE